MNPCQIEAVARAICAASDENPDHTGDCRGNDYRWQDYRAPAIAAIEAMGSQQDAISGSIPQRPQSQASLTDQLTELRPVANRLGLYDAADAIRDIFLN